MQTVQVKLAERSYPIYIGKNIWSFLAAKETADCTASHNGTVGERQ